MEGVRGGVARLVSACVVFAMRDFNTAGPMLHAPQTGKTFALLALRELPNSGSAGE